MMILKTVLHVENLLKKNEKFVDKDGNIFKQNVLEAIEKIDKDLVKLLISDEKTREQFFIKIDDVFVLEQNKLIEFFTMNEYSNNSFTSYTNKIGLIKKDSFIKKFDDVVLAWPHKDCILEGGQSKDDDKKNEVFYNEILSRDEIDRLFEPKALTNIKRYTKEGVEENPQISEDDNFIIKGNNLIALHSLKKKYAAKVKLIYIDPPYNTGNDSFKYNDRFNHSTWLTFMKNRLEVARDFLSEDGVIFVQCDDNEQAYLKVLMDEVFKKDNFVETFVWKNTDNAPTLSKKSRKNIEFIHCYEKQLKTSIAYKGRESDNDDAPLLNSGNPITILEFNSGLIHFKIEDGVYEKGIYDKVELLDNLQIKEGKNENKIKLKGRFKWQQSFLNQEVENRTFFLIKTLKFSIRYQRENASNIAPDKFFDSTYISKAIGVETNEDSKKHIDNLDLDFPSYPKPESLIAYLIKAVTNPNDLVMDYNEPFFQDQ